MITLNTIYNENCLETMKRMSDNFIDMVLTSPPYDNRRNYEEEHKFMFEEFKLIAKELFRVTKEGGIIVWIVNDGTINFCKSLTSFKQAIYFVDICKFNLLDTMIYYKKCIPPVYPDVIKYHYAPYFEYMFILCKGVPKTFNSLKIKCFSTSKIRQNTQRQVNGKLIKSIFKSKESKVKGNIWEIMSNDNTDNKENNSIHPAVFPKQLVIDHIKSWSNEEDIVFDPFSGSGTTAKCCKLMNRKFIGSEIVKKYWLLGNITIKRTDDRKKGSELWKI